ncbi:MAG: MBL fold metallo-hydrolase [Dysgonamonadaceae bacterium]|jgi:glyoxylase-like metal-dependent hydrolase (beta-lactamase superfamily II)|nr:MBL fold metallo-hydrolase [Dysgonamonadaceae bacterium]
MLTVKTFVFNQVYENTYLIYDETKEAAIIDCGALDPSERAELSDFITKNELKLKHLLNTHLHLDHTFGNPYILDNYGIKPKYNIEDEEMPYKQGYVKTDCYIGDGDEIRFGNTVLKVITTPGHSPGGLSFYCEAAKCVFTGDTLFHLSIGRTDLWRGNYGVLLDSIKSKLFTLPEDTVVYPGHEETSTIGEEKMENPYF